MVDRQDKPEYSIVVPVYGSADSLEELHARIKTTMEAITPHYELVLVNDCSPDYARAVLTDLANKDHRIVALELMSNAGQGAATLCGMAQAGGRYIITMDDDLQHPPEEIPVLIGALRNNPDLDVVMGRPATKQHNPVRRLGSRIVHEINSLLLGKDRRVYFTSFRILHRRVAEVLLSLRTPHPALGPMINSVTRNIGNITVRHDPRKAGKSGYSPIRIVRQLIGNFVGYSMLPLHLVGIIGIAGVIVSFLLGLFFLIRYWTGGIGVEGWTTIVLLVLMLSGVTFFAFAVLGEYLLKILQLGSGRPQYVVRSVIRGADPDHGRRNAEENTRPLTDGVVYLRRLEAADLDRTLGWMQRSDIRSALGIKGEVTRESQDRWFGELMQAADKVVFAVCLCKNDEHVGNVSLDQIDLSHRHARFSIFLADSEQRGRGIGTRAMRLLMVEAFENRELQKIWCKTTAGDEKVLDFYKHLGFEIEGAWRRHELIDGQFVDKTLLGMLRADWQRGPTESPSQQA